MVAAGGEVPKTISQPVRFLLSLWAVACLATAAAGETARLDVRSVPPENGVFEAPGLVVLVQGSMVLALDRTNGALAHIIHRPSGQDFLSTTEQRPLFTIRLSRAKPVREQEVSAADFRKVSIARRGKDAWQLIYTDHPTLPLAAQVIIKSGADNLAHFSLVLSNRSDWAATRIQFPDMVWTPTLGKAAEDDRLILPWMDGAILPRPGATWMNRSMLYPGPAFTQFTAYYDASCGLFFGAEDAEGHCKQWELRLRPRKQVQMALSHLRPEAPGRDVALPYDVVLGTFRGDWMDAADIYKRWARSQPWCARTLRERTDIPQYLKEGAGVIIGGIQGPEGYNGLLGKDLEKLPQLAADYRRRTELAHIIFIPYGWENRGTWAGINYFPALPSDEAWRNACSALRAQGDRVAFLTSGYWWVVKRQAGACGPGFDDSAQIESRKDLLVAQPDGQPFAFDNYANTNQNGSWRGLSFRLCHGSPAANEVMKNLFLQAARLGVSLVSFDQEIGGGQPEPCYLPSHPHSPGYGNWMWIGFRDTCARILQEGKPIQPELGLLLENVSELAIPYMSTYWSRQFGELDHGASAARGVALFSYLYHEHVTCIGAACAQGQGQRGTRPSAGLRCFILANNLTRGLIPGPFMWDVPLDPGDSWHTEVAAAYFSYCKPYARFPEYLVLGITRRPPAIRCANHEVRYWRGEARVDTAATLPAVTAGSFEALDGSVGTIIVNTTSEAQDATVELRPGGKGARLYRADRTEVQRWDQAPSQIPLKLEPYGTRMLVVKGSATIPLARRP